MTNELVALLDGKEVGRVRRDARGRLAFFYDGAWRTATDAYPLSLSMPLGAREHGRNVVEAFLWGLLPDNSRRRLVRRTSTKIAPKRPQPMADTIA